MTSICCSNVLPHASWCWNCKTSPGPAENLFKPLAVRVHWHQHNTVFVSPMRMTLWRFFPLVPGHSDANMSSMVTDAMPLWRNEATSWRSASYGARAPLHHPHSQAQMGGRTDNRWSTNWHSLDLRAGPSAMQRVWSGPTSRRTDPLAQSLHLQGRWRWTPHHRQAELQAIDHHRR